MSRPEGLAAVNSTLAGAQDSLVLLGGLLVLAQQLVAQVQAAIAQVQRERAERDQAAIVAADTAVAARPGGTPGGQ